MTDPYAKNVMRMSIAQICESIGYKSLQLTPLELLQDCLHKFLHEFSRDFRRHAEHYKGIEANFNDVCLTLRSLSINVNELLEYIFNVESVRFTFGVPKFPLHKRYGLCSAKLCDKEVLKSFENLTSSSLPNGCAQESDTNGINKTSPIQKSSLFKISTNHVNESSTVQVKSDFDIVTMSEHGAYPKIESDIKTKSNVKFDHFSNYSKESASIRSLHAEESPIRAIDDVTMEIGGPTSPAAEGKLPDRYVPCIIDILDGLDAVRPSAPNMSVASGYLLSNDIATVPVPLMPPFILTKIQKKPRTKNGHAEKCNPTLDSRTSQVRHASVLGGICNSNLYTIATTAALGFSKQHVPVQYTTLSPPPAAQIVKNLKERHTISPFATQVSSSISGCTPIALNEGSTARDVNLKIQRKRMRMFQKLVKSASSTEIESCFFDCNGSLKTVCNTVQMERILRKQVKQKQKFLKKQLVLELNSKYSSNSEHSHQEFSCIEISNSRTSSTITSSDQLSGFASMTVNHLETKIEKQINNAKAKSFEDRGCCKPNSVVQKHSLNSSPCRAQKPKKSSLPITGKHLAYDDDEIRTDLCVNKPPDHKLSTEPDRSKLNILKKISSTQKNINRSISTEPEASSIQTKIYAENSNQFINLPSGTTITPAPPTSYSTNCYSSEGEEFLPLMNAIKNNNIIRKINNNIGPKILGKANIDRQLQSMELINIPINRGSKPGYRNQSKVNRMNLVYTKLKKSNELNFQKQIAAPLLQLPYDQDAEPLNLSHPISLGCDIKTNNVSLGIASASYSWLESNTSIKEGKEERKVTTVASKILTTRNTIDNTMIPQLQQRHLHGLQQFHKPPRNPIKPSIDSSFSAPTKEEVGSLNRKLLKMDTLLQPTSSMKSSIISTHNHESSSLLTSKEEPTPTMCNISGASIHRLRCDKLKSDVGDMLSTSYGVPLLPSVPDFPNLSPNVLPVLPMYAFPPRPSLIPTAGLFPSVLGTYPSNPCTASNIMLQDVLPSSGFQSSNCGSVLNPGLKLKDGINSGHSIKGAISGEVRAFCNVGATVADSIGTAATSLFPPKLSNLYYRDNQKGPQFIQSTTVSESIRESLQLKFSTLGSSETKTSKSITSMPKDDDLLRNVSGISANSSLTNSIGFTDMFKPIISTQGIDPQKFVGSIPSLNIVNRVEVSDGSVGRMMSTIRNSNKCKPLRCYLKAPTLPAPLIQMDQADDSFIPTECTSRSTDIKQFSLPNNDNIKIKKSKRIYSINSAEAGIDIVAACASECEIEGISKLAGGADLIPLSAAGLAHLSKKSPSSSLTASIRLEINKYRALDNFTDTASPSADIDEKHECHKKLKKLAKHSKLKKNKYKREKGRGEVKYVHRKQQNKKGSAKVQQGRRREDQRPAEDSTSILANSPNNSVPMNSEDTLLITTATYVDPSSPIVSKLTSHLRSCQPSTRFDEMIFKRSQKSGSRSRVAMFIINREPSPELARISPLVTRTAKQNSGRIDNASCSDTAEDRGGVTPTINNLGTTNTKDLIENRSIDNVCKLQSDIKSVIPPSSSWSPCDNLTAGSTLLPQQLLQSSALEHLYVDPTTSTSDRNITNSTSSPFHETNRPLSYIVEGGNRVWICPACGKVDDGSAMIGCDGCDAWYHWTCVGIYEAPTDNEDWFCRMCIAKNKTIHSANRKFKRKKTKKINIY